MNRRTFPFLLAIGVLVAVFSVFVASAHANPDQILVSSNNATTTRTFMTPTTATTTEIFDTQTDGGLPVKSAVLLVQEDASSSGGTLNIAIEYAQQGTACDTNPTNCDWYSDNISGAAASTSAVYSMQVPYKYQMVYASTTVGQGTSTPMLRAISIPTPTRYVRAAFSVSSTTAVAATQGSGNVNIWKQFVGKKETR